jgi:hypothetical protein
MFLFMLLQEQLQLHPSMQLLWEQLLLHFRL